MSKIFDWDEDALVDTNVVIKEELINNIVPNPTGTATATLSKLKLGKDIYSISGGGGGSYTAGNGINISADNVISVDTTTGVSSPKFTGTVSADNIVVSGYLTAVPGGTPITDFDMSNAKTFIIPHITLVEPTTATSGTITESQLATLQSSECAYIVFNNEKYYLNDNQHTTGSLGYTHCGYENNEFKVKNITITISTRSWVLSVGYVNPNHLYQHNIQFNYVNSSATGFEEIADIINLRITLFTTSEDSITTTSALTTALTDYATELGGHGFVLANWQQGLHAGTGTGSSQIVFNSLALSTTGISISYYYQGGSGGWLQSCLGHSISYTDFSTRVSSITDNVIQLR